MDIDYVFPYVDCTDPAWQVMAKPLWPQGKWQPERFRDFGWLKYLLRALDENLPWLHSVAMLVDFDSQVPTWVDRSAVRVVTLDKFVPAEYLPTFNSNTIEMFLGDVPGLAEHIIYGNDDFFPLSPLSPDQYFTDTGIPKISYNKKNKLNTLFRLQCKKNWKTVVSHLPDYENEPTDVFYEQTHDPQSITITLIKEAARLTEKERLDSITQKRNFAKNLSQYLYFDYAIATKQCVERKALHKFKSLKKEDAPEILRIINDRIVPWVCLNDSEKTSLSIIPIITKALQKRYPNKCKYEL